MAKRRSATAFKKIMAGMMDALVHAKGSEKPEPRRQDAPNDMADEAAG